jgi:hypothetical protein
VQFLGDGDEVPKFACLEIVHTDSLPTDTRGVSQCTDSILDGA